jgi:hypothetical protein
MLSRIATSLHDVERMQKRMHNKLFIADNAWGIAGGRNLGDAYFGEGEKQNFVDLDVLAAGRIVRDMSASFDRFWNDELSYPVETLLDKEDLEALRKPQPAASAASAAARPGEAAAATPPAPVASANPNGVLPSVNPTAVVRAERPAHGPAHRAPDLGALGAAGRQAGQGRPGRRRRSMRATPPSRPAVADPGRAARRLIISPYFVPGPRMLAIYQELHRRGVRVRVLTNSLASNDAPAAHAGYARYRKDLLAAGVQIYEMRSDPAALSNLIGPIRAAPVPAVVRLRVRLTGHRGQHRQRAGRLQERQPRAGPRQPALQGGADRRPPGGDRLHEPRPALGPEEQRGRPRDSQRRAGAAGHADHRAHLRHGRPIASSSATARSTGVRPPARPSATRTRSRARAAS